MRKKIYNENYFETIDSIYYGFYFDSNFFLQRKRLIFDKVIETIGNKQKYRKK